MDNLEGSDSWFPVTVLSDLVSSIYGRHEGSWLGNGIFWSSQKRYGSVRWPGEQLAINDRGTDLILSRDGFSDSASRQP